MELFNEIWLKVGEHGYIYIFEIKFEKKKYSVSKWQPKQVKGVLHLLTQINMFCALPKNIRHLLEK